MSLIGQETRVALVQVVQEHQRITLQNHPAVSEEIYGGPYVAYCCDWQLLTADKFDWTRNHGGTGTGGTGPWEDYTTESPSGK